MNQKRLLKEFAQKNGFVKIAVKAFIHKYYSETSDFRVQIFNTLGFLGFVLGIVFGVFSLLLHPEILNVISNFTASAFAAFALWRANKTRNFKHYFLFTVVSVFIVIFPILFFIGGGIVSGMPSFFIFAVVFTIIMLEGRRRTFFTVLEIVLYSLCFMTAWFYPETIAPFPAEANMLRDIIAACLASSVVLAIAIYQHIVVYDRKQKELEKANEQLRGLNSMKTEFLQDIKHEIRNPLHVISYCADSVHHYINKGANASEAHNVLNTMQNEAVRLGRMINGMVDLAIMGGRSASRERVDFAAMLNQCAETFRLGLEQKQIVLRIKIAPDLPYVYAEAEQLERVPVNLLSNAANCTQDGEIVIEARADEGYISVQVSDTGEGIPPDILPNVLVRGVSGKGDQGYGYGLSICKTVVEAHGGTIKIESEPSKGTVVTFTVPVYGGQSEVRERK